MTSAGSQRPGPVRPRSEVANEAYEVLRARLRLNFLIALWTNVVALVILLGGAAAATALLLADEFAAAAVPGLIAVTDIVYGAVERPWRQLCSPTTG